MQSFEQLLLEGLLATIVKDKKFLFLARRALKNIGLPSEGTQFSLLNIRKGEELNFAKILSSRGSYGVKTKNVYVIGLPKNLTVGEDRQNRHCAVYKVPPANGNAVLYKLVPILGTDRHTPKAVSKADFQKETSQWERFLVVTEFGGEQNQQQGQGQQNQNSDQKAGEAPTNKTASGPVDLGEYVNPFRDRVAKIPGYQLMACYVSKRDGKPHVQVKAGRYDIGLAFVEFNDPIAKGGKLAFNCRTLSPKNLLEVLDTTSIWAKAKSLLGFTTTDVDKYRSSTVVIGEAFKDVVSAMQGSAEVAQILSEIEINKLPVK